jgi:cytochrome P450
MRITVVSSTDTLASILRDQTKALYAGEQNMHMFHAVAEIDINHTFVYEVTDKMLFPIIADCLSKSSLENFTTDFARHLLRFLEPLSNATTETTLPLSDLVGEAMYQAASLAIFGPLFPTDSHKDFALLDGNVHILLLQLPFTARPAVRARHRLLSLVSAYIKDGWRSEGDGYIEGASELASGCVRVLKNTTLSDADVAAAFLSFMWGIHAMSVRSSFWVMAHILTHDDAMKQIREEADAAIVATPGGLPAFLKLPSALDPERLPLLESAVKETVRLITVTGGLREALADVEIRGTDQTYVVPKGEYVLAYPRHQNHDEKYFPDPNTYKFDRFAVEESKMNLNVTRMSWGGGKHLVLFGSSFVFSGLHTRVIP